CRLKRTREHVLACLRQPNVRHPPPSPPASDGQKDLWQFAHKTGLLLRSKHQVPIALAFGGERSKDPASHSEVGRSHVRPFLCPLKAQGNAAKICWPHGQQLLFSESSESSAKSVRYRPAWGPATFDAIGCGNARAGPSPPEPAERHAPLYFSKLKENFPMRCRIAPVLDAGVAGRIAITTGHRSPCS